jgi:predicted enzyme related to lactoylglutathione lyase
MNADSDLLSAYSAFICVPIRLLLQNCAVALRQLDIAGELDAGGIVLALHGGGQGRLGQDAPKIVFGVDDVEAARAALLANGVAVDEVRSAAPGVWVCDGRDLEGNRFSIESHDSS